MSNFEQLGLDNQILKVLKEIGYENPTPIQARTIPKVLNGSDIIASAQTGSGKTAAFMLPALHLLGQPAFRGKNGPQVLILVPTRELAMQVADQAKKFSKYVAKTKTVCIYGGIPYPIQRRALASKYEILVATPGRLIDHVERGRIDLGNVKLLVLDEADRMLDMGFIADVEKIASQTPQDRQTVMFSATIDGKILPYSKKLQNNPHQIAVESTHDTDQTIEKHLYYVDGLTHKQELLEHLLTSGMMQQSIIFTSTIQQTERLASDLQEKGFLCDCLNGDMNQRQRTKVLDKLRKQEIRFVVATDVAARGIDIATISHVVNFDLPFQPEDFIHRIGRTGRAGSKGTAITFSTYKEAPKLERINKLFKTPFALHTIAGLEPKTAMISSKPKNSRSKPFFKRSHKRSGPLTKNGTRFKS